jgi:hypothetical protein
VGAKDGAAWPVSHPSGKTAVHGGYSCQSPLLGSVDDMYNADLGVYNISDVPLAMMYS